MTRIERFWDWLRERMQIGILAEGTVMRLLRAHEDALSKHLALDRTARALTDRPMMFVLVMGTDPSGKRVMAGGSRSLSNNNADTLDIQTMVPMKDVSIIAFADLARVNIEAIMLGNQILTFGVPGVGTPHCPIAFTPEWFGGMTIYVRASVRR